MRTLFYLFISLLIGVSSCSKNNLDDQRAQDELELSNQLKEIKDLANSVTCTDSEDWEFIAYGSKACGGPQGYIAYSMQIDVDKFKQMVSDYTQAEKDFNINYQITSDCKAEISPNGVVCKDGKPVLIYNN